jgi:NAD(P)H-hydrate repair Nnr-like enzyme with NAD(P)H-hydrate dehydratase domain
MGQMKYWRKQDKQALFGEIDVAKPERKQLAGRLLILGGNKSSFFAVANVMNKAVEVGVGEVKILLPDSLKKQIPIESDVVFVPSDASGGFGKDALKFATLAMDDVDAALMIGDMGKNSETATFAERFVAETTKPVLITRDAVDLMAMSAGGWLERDGVILCATLPQLQKIFRAVYYPKMITLSMPLNQLIETLHKFTITYAALIVTLHNGQVVIAKDGEVVTTELNVTTYNPINIWTGELAAKIMALKLWNEKMSFESAVTAILA